MRVGVIGTGNMGGPIAANLLKAGHEVFVHDIRKAATEALVKVGAKWCESPKEMAQACRLIMTSLPGAKEVEEVALSEKGIFAGAQRGDIFIDLSTNAPSAIRRIAQLGKEKGIIVLDAPLVGGTWGAQSGTLTIMVGGDEEALGKSRPVLEAVGRKIIHLGDVGSGNIAKLINNMLTQVHMHSIAEAMALGARAGLDLHKLYDILSEGTATSPILTKKYPEYGFKGNFEPGFSINLAYKDQELLTTLGRELGVPLYFANLVLQRLIDARARGLGEKDTTALLLPLEELLKVRIRLDVHKGA